LHFSIPKSQLLQADIKIDKHTYSIKLVAKLNRLKGVVFDNVFCIIFSF